MKPDLVNSPASRLPTSWCMPVCQLLSCLRVPRYGMMPLWLWLLFACVSQRATGQEIQLFNGRDLSGWKETAGSAEFRVSEGCIIGRNRRVEDGHSYLTTNAEFGDFILTFEFKAEEGLNSGVQFRSQLHDYETSFAGPQGNMKTRRPGQVYGYQYEIDTRKLRNSGALYDEARRGVFLDDLASNPAAQGAMKWNGWNQARIECRGSSIKTFINGVPAANVSDGMTLKGVIALQVHALNPPGKEVRWKNIRLLTLGTMAGAEGGVPALAMVQTDASQSRIQVVKEQGPNAAEWALTPLEESIPSDIRQNLMFLREDLLDEGKKGTQAGAGAYKLASEYCDKLLAALDQRDLARVNAGYATAQADANKVFSNQALDARRNYKMSWPQYAREESQRSALRESEDNKADVKKQRLKVEWMSRAVQMRGYLDDLYRRLRESMR